MLTPEKVKVVKESTSVSSQKLLKGLHLKTVLLHCPESAGSNTRCDITLRSNKYNTKQVDIKQKQDF